MKEKIAVGVSNLFSFDVPKLDPNVSLLDKRWELSPESKLGTWNLRAYQPVYLMPAYWTSDKNERPSSPNEQNTFKWVRSKT